MWGFVRIGSFPLSYYIYVCTVVCRCSLTVLFISAKSIVISSSSFLILVTCVFSYFFIVRLARGLPILLIFSKNHIFVLLILSGFLCFVSISLIYTLFIISFFCLLWVHFALLFLDSWDDSIGLRLFLFSDVCILVLYISLSVLL